MYDCAFLRTRFSCIRPRLTLALPSVTGALVMEITYGLDIKSHDDKFLKAAEHAAEYIIKAMVPGAFLVDTFPIRSSSFRFLAPALCL